MKEKNIMKFVSKNPNLRIVLSPGIPGERLTGRLPIGMKSIKFIDGMAEVKNEEFLQLALAHAGFNHDFFELPEEGKDPFAGTRRSTEPEHDVMQIDYGHPGKNLNPRSPVPLSIEQKRLLTEMATAMTKEALKDLVPKMAKDMLKELVAIQNSRKTEEVKSDSADSSESVVTGPGPDAESKVVEEEEKKAPVVLDPETGEEKGVLEKRTLPLTQESDVNELDTVKPSSGSKQPKKKK